MELYKAIWHEKGGAHIVYLMAESATDTVKRARKFFKVDPSILIYGMAIGRPEQEAVANRPMFSVFGFPAFRKKILAPKRKR